MRHRPGQGPGHLCEAGLPQRPVAGMHHQVVGFKGPGQLQFPRQPLGGQGIKSRIGRGQVGEIPEMHHQGSQPRQASGSTKIPHCRRRHRAPFPAPGILDKDLEGLAAQDLGLIDRPAQ